jgi:hypothetical protein
LATKKRKKCGREIKICKGGESKYTAHCSAEERERGGKEGAAAAAAQQQHQHQTAVEEEAAAKPPSISALAHLYMQV